MKNVFKPKMGRTFRHKKLKLRWFSEIIEKTTKNGFVPVATGNVKLFLKTI